MSYLLSLFHQKNKILKFIAKYLDYIDLFILYIGSDSFEGLHFGKKKSKKNLI